MIETKAGVLCDTTFEPTCACPKTTLNAPFGKNGAAISASNNVLSGVVSLGLSTTVLPAAKAGAIFQTAIMSG